MQKSQTMVLVKFLRKSFNQLLRDSRRILWRNLCKKFWRYIWSNFLYNFYSYLYTKIAKLLLWKSSEGNPIETIKKSTRNSLENHWRHAKGMFDGIFGIIRERIEEFAAIIHEKILKKPWKMERNRIWTNFCRNCWENLEKYYRNSRRKV